MGFTKTGVRLLWKPATYFLGKGCNVLILFFILQSTNEVLLLALFQRVLVWFFFSLILFMPKTGLHAKSIICTWVSAGNQVAELGESLI